MRRLLAIALLAPGLALAATHTVTIEGMKFTPATLTVKRGDRIVWNNRDVVPHTATAAGVFDSGSIAAGRSWATTVKKAGTQPYVCRFHPGMKGEVVVQ